MKPAKRHDEPRRLAVYRRRVDTPLYLESKAPIDRDYPQYGYWNDKDLAEMCRPQGSRSVSLDEVSQQH